MCYSYRINYWCINLDVDNNECLLGENSRCSQRENKECEVFEEDNNLNYLEMIKNIQFQEPDKKINNLNYTSSQLLIASKI